MNRSYWNWRRVWMPCLLIVITSGCSGKPIWAPSTTGLLVGKTENSIECIDLDTGAARTLLALEGFRPLKRATIAYDPEQDVLYVLDSANARNALLKYEPDSGGHGREIASFASWAVAGPRDPGYDMALCPSGRKLCVVGSFGPTHMVAMIDTASGRCETLRLDIPGGQWVAAFVEWIDETRILFGLGESRGPFVLHEFQVASGKINIVCTQMGSVAVLPGGKSAIMVDTINEDEHGLYWTIDLVNRKAVAHRVGRSRLFPSRGRICAVAPGIVVQRGGTGVFGPLMIGIDVGTYLRNLSTGESWRITGMVLGDMGYIPQGTGVGSLEN